jgi:hypothetical protein
MPKSKPKKARSVETRFSELISRESIFPLVLLLICFLAFGLLFRSLGFYWDDWTNIFVRKSSGIPGLIDFYQYDRPFSVWLHVLTGSLTGLNPNLWQALFLGIRWLAAIAMWAVLGQIWPKQSYLPVAAALLFAIYPTFIQQPIAVTYSPIFLDFALYFLSIWAMLRAVRDSRNYWRWTLLAIVAAALHLVSFEYFSGLEFARPIFLYLVLRKRSSPFLQNAKEAIKHWIPYLLLLLAFVIWRIFFLTVIDDPNQATLFASLIKDPFATVVNSVQNVFRYLVHILFTGWYPSFQPDLVNFSDRVLLTSGLVVLVTIAICTAYLFYLDKRSKRNKVPPNDADAENAIVFGLLAVCCGMLPVLATERDLFSGLFSDRFTIPALFGAALFWAGFAQLSLKDALHRSLLIGVLVGLAVGVHIRTSNVYRRDWEKQSRIYWQMVWRAGKLEANTPIIATGALSGYVNEFSASAAINVLYESPIQNGNIEYWFFDLYDDFRANLEDLPNGITISGSHRNLNFSGSSSDAIYMHYSSNAQCVWFLNPSDVDNVQVPEDMRNQIQQSDLNPVNPGIQDDYRPDPFTFGPEPEHTWCYYFQKIDLAKEREDWERVLGLWVEAQEQDFGPNNQFEMMPVINAHIEMQQIETALDLSLDVYRRQPDTQQMLCTIWDDWKNSGEATPELLDQGENLFERLACQ